jgi:SAM-dependent methyltransferase
LVRQLVLASGVPRRGRILEIGCSSGKLIQELQRDGFTKVHGIDVSEPAINLCRQAGLNAEVMDAARLRFPDAEFDLITASDVLEHIADHRAALVEWHRVLKPGGQVILFVPAFMFLWTAHDVANQHCRRYRRQELRSLVQQSGLEVTRACYWNALLFPPVAIVRLIKRLIKPRIDATIAGVGDMALPPMLLNASLLRMIRVENWLLLRGVNWPAGVSVMVIARKPA